MPYGRNFKRAVPGQPVSAMEYNRLTDEVERLGNLQVASPLELSNTGMHPMIRFVNNTIIAVITGPVGCSSVREPRSWREVQPGALGTWQYVTGGRSGTVAVNSAYEANGNCVGVGSIVELVPDGRGSYRFWSCCLPLNVISSSSSSASSSSTSSSSGAAQIAVSCCSGFLPSTLYATITPGSSPCACMGSAFSFALTYNGTIWTGTHAIGSCGHNITITVSTDCILTIVFPDSCRSDITNPAGSGGCSPAWNRTTDEVSLISCCSVGGTNFTLTVTT